MKPNLREQALALARERHLLRADEARQQGIHGSTLQRLVESGDLARVSRGIYIPRDYAATEHHDLALAALRVPQGLICLLSALRHWDMTEEKPPEVWLAYESDRSRPVVPDLPLRLVRFDGPSFAHGVVRQTLQGVEVKLTSPAKTVADCFKFRRQVGLDVALAALKDYWSKRLGSLDELYQAATICHVKTVIHPYLESIL